MTIPFGTDVKVVAACVAVLALHSVDPSAAVAQPQGQRPAALVIYPRIEVAPGIDTEIYLGNAGADAVNAYCVYTNGQGHCSGTGEACQPDVGCSIAQQACIPECTHTDFFVELTPGQIVEWSVSAGLSPLPLFPAQIGFVPAAPTAPFIGQLRCLEVDGNENPVARNDLVGSAAIAGPGISIASYEAIAVRSTGVNDGDDTLCLGADPQGECATAEYAQCPDSLSLNQLFEGASLAGAAVENRLTLVPCSIFYVPRPGKPDPDLVSIDVTLHVYNEFEQETTATLQLGCFRDLHLSSLPAFSVATQGTLGGQTVVSSAQADPDTGPGVVGIVQQMLVGGTNPSSSAHGLTTLGTAARADSITLLQLP